MRKLIEKILRIISPYLPRGEKVVLRGYPFYDDNLISIYNSLQSRGWTEIVWVTDDVSKYPPTIDWNKNLILVKYKSIRDLYYSIFSRYLFITDGYIFEAPLPGQIVINLWHGIPLKRIGKLSGDKARRDSILIATSDFTKDIFYKSFNTNINDIIITGQPRTDRMLSANKNNVLARLYEINLKRKKILIWLPTFRKSDYRKGKIDGHQYNNIYNCSNFSDAVFNKILLENNAICFVKPHPLAKRVETQYHDNIIFIDEDWLYKYNLSLYELIGISDLLISDISSVIVDYILLDRPMVLLFEDLIEYEKSRGFSLNPLCDYLPAEIATNFEEFIDQLEAALVGADVYSSRRAKLLRLFFEHTDANSTNRILDKIPIKEK